MIGAGRRAARATSGDSSRLAANSGVTFSRYGLRLTWSTGAVAHEPRHSTSAIAKRPSGVAVPDLNSEPALELAHHAARATQAAWQIGADLNYRLRAGQIEERVERSDLGDLVGVHPEKRRELRESLGTERTEIVARQVDAPPAARRAGWESAPARCGSFPAFQPTRPSSSTLGLLSQPAL